MCGRFTLRANLNRILQEFDAESLPDDTWDPRYNIAPTQPIVTIAMQNGKRVASLRRWGLIPFWAKDNKVANRLINARAETVATTPAFRSPFKHRRCLVAADGFYEWMKTADGKQPYFLHRKDEQPFAFAGLYEHWDKGEPADTATIITTTANELMEDIHDRMPAILAPDDFGLWLDPEFEGREKLLSLLKPCPEDQMVATPVSTLVNSPKHESPDCVVPS